VVTTEKYKQNIGSRWGKGEIFLLESVWANIHTWPQVTASREVDIIKFS
jgi:hypothetical protein